MHALLFPGQTTCDDGFPSLSGLSGSEFPGNSDVVELKMTSQKPDTKCIDGKGEKALRNNSVPGYVFLVKEVPTCNSGIRETRYFKPEVKAGNNAPNETDINNFHPQNPRQLRFVTNSNGTKYYYVNDTVAELRAANYKFKSRPDLVKPNKLGGGQNWFQKIDNINWEAIMQVFEP